jgi:hypothetical protein
MRVYRVIWNHEPEKLFLAASVADAIAQDVEATRREWSDGEGVEDWAGADGYERLLTSVECIGEVEEPYEYASALHTLILERITKMASHDPPAESREGVELALLAELCEVYEKQKWPFSAVSEDPS